MMRLLHRRLLLLIASSGRPSFSVVSRKEERGSKTEKQGAFSFFEKIFFSHPKTSSGSSKKADTNIIYSQLT